MRFSPNTLNTVIAVLSCENVPNLTPERLNAALQLLTGEQNTSPDLQPGEIYISKHEDENSIEQHTSKERLIEYLIDLYESENGGRSYMRDIDDIVTVWVARREIRLLGQRKVSVTIS